MIFKIKHKLFFAIILANVFVVFGIYLLSSVSFSTSFREYLDANREKELVPLIEAMKREYKAQKSWDWLADRSDPTWRNLIETYVLDKELLGNFTPTNAQFHRPPRRFSMEDESLGNQEPRQNRRKRPDDRRHVPPHERNHRQHEHRGDGERRDAGYRDGRRGPPPGPGNYRPNRGPGPGPRPGGPPKLFVADKNKQVLLGRKESVDQVNWIPILENGQSIGFLGYYRTIEITSELDRLFVDRLSSHLGWSVVLVIIVAGLIVFVLSRLLTQPITRLRAATEKMSSGKFETRLEVSSNDEIGELCRDFNRLSESLESNLKARQQWIADISHELRTPVSILQGELEAIIDGVRKNGPETIQSLHQEIKRLAFLINDLHELSMSDLGALSYRFESVDVIELIDNLLDSNRSRIEQAGFNVIHNIELNTISLSGDYQRLSQLFANLLNNTIAYSDADGTIHIEYHQTAKHVSIRWSDSGPGVSDEQLDKLFERLYRTDSSRNRNTGGSGLGLSIVSNIVQAHHGTISASHSPLGGVTFEVTLPAN